MKIRILTFFVLLSVTLFVFAGLIETTSMTVPATIAASSTNSTLQTGSNIERKEQNNMWMITCGLKSTNTTATGTVRFKFVTSIDNTTYTDGATTLLYVDVPLNGTTTVVGNDYFQLTGAKWIALSRVENPNAYYLTNLTATLSYSK